MAISEEYRDMYVVSVEMDDKIYIIGSISNGSPNFAGFEGSSDYRKFIKKIREVAFQGLDKIYTLPYSGSPRLHLMDSLDDSILSEDVNILTAEYGDIMSISYIECSGKYARTWRESGTPISLNRRRKMVTKSCPV